MFILVTCANWNGTCAARMNSSLRSLVISWSILTLEYVQICTVGRHQFAALIGWLSQGQVVHCNVFKWKLTPGITDHAAETGAQGPWRISIYVGAPRSCFPSQILLSEKKLPEKGGFGGKKFSVRYCRPQRPRLRAPPQISRKKGLAEAQCCVSTEVFWEHSVI